jgi:ribosome biogenesis GTPase / thiamine phosphate phosphatase
MQLSELGFDAWFQQKRNEIKRPELNVARITRVDRERYLVRNEKNELQAEAAGKLLFTVDSSQDLPSVGDWALVQYYNEGNLAIIHDLLPRKSFLRRKAAGKKVDYQIIASNIDVAFVMQSCDDNFNIRRLERYLVMVDDGHIEPIILLSKSDLISVEELDARISAIRQAHINARVIPFSNMTDAGLQTLQQTLEKGKTYCLLGSSGVGKTTLLNHLLGREEFETNSVREKDGRGRHTTSRRQLTLLENGALLIDTPGMRELGMIDVGSSIDESFSDIHELALTCRFKDCTHTVETGCAILKAVENEELDEDRYQNYLKLMKESEFYQMSYIEKRKKDKQFGRMINVAMKQMHKRKPSA